MSLTKVDIYNLSLFNIGHSRRVNSPTENSQERQNCDAVYEQKKRGLLSMANWSFAKAEIALSLTGESVTGWEYEYYYPQGCLKAIQIARANSLIKPIPFQRGLRYDQTSGAETAVLLTNEPNAKLFYIREITDPKIFTPKFVDTLSHYMSIDLARVMAKQKQVVDDMKSLFTYHLGEAIRMGEAEAQDEQAPDADWIRLAYGTEELET
jgi:hypothetical protein